MLICANIFSSFLLQLSHLSSFTSDEALGSPLLVILQPLLECIQSLSSSFSSLFPALKDDKLRCDGESVLSVWTRESLHNYENNTRLSEVRWYCTSVFDYNSHQCCVPCGLAPPPYFTHCLLMFLLIDQFVLLSEYKTPINVVYSYMYIISSSIILGRLV